MIVLLRCVPMLVGAHDHRASSLLCPDLVGSKFLLTLRCWRRLLVYGGVGAGMKGIAPGSVEIVRVFSE